MSYKSLIKLLQIYFDLNYYINLDFYIDKNLKL